MAKAKTGVSISAHIPNELVRVLEERGAELNLSRGQFMGQILERWFQQGCPAVSFADEAVMRLAAETKKGAFAPSDTLHAPRKKTQKKRRKPEAYIDKDGTRHLPGGIIARPNPLPPPTASDDTNNDLSNVSGG